MRVVKDEVRELVGSQIKFRHQIGDEELIIRLRRNR